MLILPLMAMAESIDHENILKVQYGWVSYVDPYLSPLRYSGKRLAIGNEWWQPYRKETKLGQTSKLDHWAHVGRLNVYGWRTYSSAMTNINYALGFQTGWGSYYEWRWCDNRLRLLLGPYLETELTVRQHVSQVNKPLSVDFGLHAEAMTGLSWSFYGKKTSYRLRYLFRTNLIGMDVMPQYWQSYYEISEGVRADVRCAGAWNNNIIRHELTLDFQFPHSTWRLGAEHEWLNYRSSNMQFERHQIELVIGCIWHYKIKGNNRL